MVRIDSQNLLIQRGCLSHVLLLKHHGSFEKIVGEGMGYKATIEGSVLGNRS